MKELHIPVQETASTPLKYSNMLGVKDCNISVQESPNSYSTPLKDSDLLPAHSSMSVGTPIRGFNISLQESPIKFRTPIRDSNMSVLEPTKLGTSLLSDINISMQESPKAGSQTYIEIPNNVLRKLDPNDESIIDQINTELKFMQLKQSDRLLSRLKKEISRTKNDYRKLRNGYKKKNEI